MPTTQDPDHCPTCQRRITDIDPDGCELSTGQRVCLTHLTPELCSDPDDAELYEAWKRWAAGQATA